VLRTSACAAAPAPHAPRPHAPISLQAGKLHVGKCNITTGFFQNRVIVQVRAARDLSPPRAYAPTQINNVPLVIFLVGEGDANVGECVGALAPPPVTRTAPCSAGVLHALAPEICARLAPVGAKVESSQDAD
jgi:hypothetical protein